MKHKLLYTVFSVLLIALLAAGVYYYVSLIMPTIFVLWDTPIPGFGN